ncbi:outer membrane beta-barrel protein [Aquiflexum lacus]|uniref:outer membrane beta-barrel protein n=1 Tax=Aquiflexum lacus TaxID=2483805 RepID=UPI001892EEDF|nr:outer membrane beta-barrel protein [Aquiflexum lacus]
MNKKTSLLTIVFSLLAFSQIYGQVGLMVGPNYSNVRHNGILENSRGKLNFHYGVILAFHPFANTPELSFKTDLMVLTKGYQQNLSGEDFNLNLSFLSFAPMVRYELSEGFHVHTGIELNILAGSNVNEGLQTYRNSERAVFLGLDLFSDKFLSIFTRASFGLSPMLDYYEIHPIDGIQGQLRDIYTTTVLIGIQLNIYNEKIRF